MDEARLRSRWALDPGDSQLAVELATLLARRGTPLQARDVLVDAWSHADQTGNLIAAAARLNLDVWSGNVGQPPFRTWLGPPPMQRPERAWRFASTYRDDRFGLPVATLSDTVCLVAQSVVVGVRFVRLVAIDVGSGQIRWEQERHDVLGTGGAFAVGGRTGPVHIGWAYALGEPLQLCIDVIHPELGTVVAQDVLPLHDAIVASPSSPQWVGDSIRWPVTWVTESERIAHDFAIDGESGRFRDNGSPPRPQSWEGYAVHAARSFAADPRGIYVSDAQSSWQPLLAFESPRGSVEPGFRRDTTFFVAGQHLYAHRPHHREYARGRFIAENEAVAIDCRDGVVTSLGVGVEFACADPVGVVFAVSKRGHGLVLHRIQGSAHVPIAEIDDDRLLGAVWMGGVVVLRVQDDDGAVRLVAHEGRTGARLWAMDVADPWHQGPVPVRTGLGGVGGNGFDAFE